MSTSDFGFYSFAFSLALYALIAYRESRVIMTSEDFFYFREFRLNVISWTTANVTLGTGLMYIFGGIQKTGILFLAAPLSLFLGYILLGYYTKNVLPPEVWQQGNLLTAFGAMLDSPLGSKYRFDVLISGVMCIVFTLILSLEVYASSKLIAKCIFPNSGTASEFVVAIAMLLCSVVYTVTGGFRATVSTDKVQFVFICLFTVLIAVIFIQGVSTSSAAYNMDNLFNFKFNNLMFTITMSLGAISTQFYSILNINAAMQVDNSNRQPLFKQVGSLSFLILGSFVLFALVYSGIGNPKDLFLSVLSSSRSRYDAVGVVTIIVLVTGMTAIVMSTIDSLMISISKLLYDCTYKMSAESVDEGVKLKVIRLRTLITFGIVLVALALFCTLRPDLFLLCLSIVSAMDVFPPMLILMGILARKKILHRMAVRKSGFPLYLIYFLLWGGFCHGISCFGSTWFRVAHVFRCSGVIILFNYLDCALL